MLIVFLALSASVGVCKAQAPAYTEIKTAKGWSDQHAGLILISPKDVTKAKLLALGKTLSAANKSFPRANLQIVTDQKAAEVQNDFQNKSSMDFFAKHYVARYFKNSYKGIEDMEIMPQGLDGPSERVSLIAP